MCLYLYSYVDMFSSKCIYINVYNYIRISMSVCISMPVYKDNYFFTHIHIYLYINLFRYDICILYLYIYAVVGREYCTPPRSNYSLGYQNLLLLS